MLDTRTYVEEMLGRFEFRSGRALAKVVGCVAVAALVAYVPAYEGLTGEGRQALFILLVAAGLWVTEAMAAFAVALVVMALEIQLLGGLGRGGVATEAWLRFLRPWSSPIIWLFLGGFALAKAASRTGLDRTLAGRVLEWSGGRPGRTLAALGAAVYPAVVVPIALGASAAMCLPISTPPNALAFSSGKVAAREFLRPGLLMGLLAPPLAALWAWVVL